jgi:hypothetical protein
MVINFSHPLNDEALKVIEDKFGKIVNQKVQVDRNQPLGGQVNNLLADVFAKVNTMKNPKVEAIILPGLSDVAALVMAYFIYYEENLPYIIQMINVAEVGMKFMPMFYFHPFDDFHSFDDEIPFMEE